ncbi:MAG: bifunctional lysylphosphatidylglycerol flippase/synthetase MprF [Phycisphaerae bacterium]|nr:bifunctional lysylphosphatidylglycerol flippase/synthetase MprF [Phycisphaerae bacterium]
MTDVQGRLPASMPSPPAEDPGVHPAPSLMHRLRFWAAVVVPIAFVVLALWLLHHQFRQYKLQDILAGVGELPTWRIGLAAVLTIVAFTVLAGYDWLGFRYINHPLPLRKIATAAFISYALSYNLGYTLITGGSLRYRLYSAWGLSASEIAKVVGFCLLTFWLGLAAIAGVGLLAEPETIGSALRLPPTLTWLLGIVLLVVVGAYVLATAVWRRSITLRSWTFHLPPPWISLCQIVVTVLDLALAGTVLYVLLPQDLGLSYFAVIGIYLISVVVGLASQVPGGLGVFETTFLHLLPGSTSSAAIAGSLLAYRGIYYLMPLALASLMLAAHEVELRFKRVPLSQETVRWLTSMAPQALGVITFISGAILLFSSATPTTPSRLYILAQFLPLHVLELSHLVGSITGAVLIILSRGIQLRLDGAFWLAVIFLFVGIIASLAKGLDYEESIVLSLLLLALLPARGFFYRRASLLDEPLSAGWMVACGVVLACSVWLGLFSYKHIEYRNELWWHFAFAADAPRFMRASVAVAAVLLLAAVGRLLRPARTRIEHSSKALLDQIRPVVAASREPCAHLALLGDKEFLINDVGDAFIMYAVRGRTWVAMGGPVGPTREHADLIWRYRELVDRSGGWPIFYQVRPDSLHLYLDLGLTLLKVGEEARVCLADFSLDGGERKSLRHTHAHAGREGCSFEVLPADQNHERIAELKEISDQWLAEKNTREKRFSLGYFEPDYIARCPLALVRREGRIIAFANLWLGAEKEELSLDLMRFRPDAGQGVMDFLLTSLMLWGRDEGYRHFGLGMAPLSGFHDHPLAPLWNRAGGFVFRHGEHFYNFEGLRQYKDKFHPEWSPRYLAAPGGLALPAILIDLAALISGGIRGVVKK